MQGSASANESAGPTPVAAADDTIVIVAGADDNFALGLTVSLFSAARCLDPSRQAHFFVIDGGLSPVSRDRCRRSIASVRPDIALTFIENDPERFSEYSVHWYSRAAYLRLLIPEVIPAYYRRVLYLDSDLVVTDDVARLWDLPDEGKAFWAAYDEGVRDTNYVVETLGFANVPADAPYFNSGVMLIDLPRWKADKVSERAQAVLDEHSDLCINVDQDALNVVAIGNWSVLPPRWNFQVAGRDVWTPPPEDGQHIAITHFINDKPWKTETSCVRQSAFDSALRASGWYSAQDYRWFRMRKSAALAKRWLHASPVLALPRKVKRGVMRRARGLLAHAHS